MPLIGALVVKEFQTWLRGRLTFAVFSLMVLCLSILVYVLGLMVLAPEANAAPALFTNTGSTAPPGLIGSNRALFLFGGVGLCLLLAAAVVVPAISASAFAGERERGTLDLLLLEAPGSGRIVIGKVLAAVAFSVLVLLVAGPFFAPAWSFGGVQPEHVMSLLVVVLAATLLFSSVGVFFGALLPTALPAALFAQGIALFLLFGTLGLHLGVLALFSNDALRPLLWLDPFLALLSGGGVITEQFARQAPTAYRTSLTLPTTAWAPGLLVPGWVTGSLVWIVLAAALMFATSVAIDPCHPLRPRNRA